MKIEIFGSGCTKCKRLEKNVREAVMAIGATADIEKIEDMNTILDRGIMMTPALFIDGEVKAIGRVPGVEEIKAMMVARR